MKYGLKLKQLPVTIVDVKDVEKTYQLKELDGDQRATYNSQFDLKIEVVDGKPRASSGEGFKLPTAIDLLCLCLYDENDTLVDRAVLGKYPATVLKGLHKEAQELSGLNAEALEAAKNAQPASGSSGIG